MKARTSEWLHTINPPVFVACVCFPRTQELGERNQRARRAPRLFLLAACMRAAGTQSSGLLSAPQAPLFGLPVCTSSTAPGGWGLQAGQLSRPGTSNRTAPRIIRVNTPSKTLT